MVYGLFFIKFIIFVCLFMRLIDVVVKKSNLECGTFGNISDDLGFIENLRFQPARIQMAYGYARRAVAAGLYFQGVFTLENFQHVCMVFQGLQVQTGHTVEFQEEACAQATELLLDYDPRLTKLLMSLMVIMAHKYNTREFQYPRKSYEAVIDSFQGVITSVIKSETGDFGDDIYEHQAIMARLTIFSDLHKNSGNTFLANQEQSLNDAIKSMIYSRNLLKFKPYIGNNNTETEDNIYHGVLSLIANDDEYVRFIFEELDAAANGNDVARQFAMNSGINPSHFSGLLKSPSSIDRAGGPQQFFVSSLVSIFGSDNVLPHRINIVKKLIENGKNKGILSKYVTNVGLYKDLKLPKTREEISIKDGFISLCIFHLFCHSYAILFRVLSLYLSQFMLILNWQNQNQSAYG
ncbi:MAG: hypothetical protein ACI4VX_01800 [Succinivibrionaceae bacterium]